MADITMCKGTNCPLKESCYRFTAPENEYRQSYFMNPPIEFVDNKAVCRDYWNNSRFSKPEPDKTETA